MLKTLLFTMLLRLGWVDQADSPGCIKSTLASLSKPLRQSLPGPNGIPEGPAKGQSGFPGALWKQAAKTHGVDPVLLYSVALFESGKRGGRNKVGPWPFALHFNKADVSIYASSVKEASFVLAHVTTENVDIGLGQVNYKSHKDKVQRPEDLLDPKINLTVASQILAEALRSTPDLELGVGRYHSWTEWRARAYGRKVLTIYQALKENLAKQKPHGVS